MSLAKRSLPILEVLDSMKQASRMQIFEAFDGQTSWTSIKRIIGFLSSQGLIASVKSEVPPQTTLWSLTESGKQTVQVFINETTIV